MKNWIYIALIVVLSIFTTVDINTVYGEGDKGLYVVTSIPVLADIASNIVGDYGVTYSLVKPGRHVSTYELTPIDSERIWLADVFLYVGYGSEEAIGQYASAIRDGINVYNIRDLVRDEVEGVDENPYFWLDPYNTIKLVERLTDLFITLKPEYGDIYMLNSKAYIEELKILDSWIRNRTSELDDESKILFTVRNGLKYYAERYGFKIGGYITGSAGVYEPSTTWVINQFEEIEETGVKVLFIEYIEKGTTLREVIETLAEEAGIETVGFIYLESLSPEDGVSTYIDMMKANTNLIVDSIKEYGVIKLSNGEGPSIFDNPVLKPFKYGFMVRGFLTLMFIMAITPVVGAYAVLRGWSIFSDALGHGAIVGLLIAYLFSIDFYLGALLIGLFIAFAVGSIERTTRLRADVVIAFTFTSMLALAIIIISNIGGVNIALEDVLFADVTAVSTEMMWRTIASATAIGIFVYIFRRQLLLYSLDPLGAISLGIRSDVLHYLYLILLAITTISAFMSIGAIPAIAAIIVPPAASYLVTKRPKQYLITSMIFGIISGLTGFYISYYLNVNAGAATIMVSALIFLITIVIHVLERPPTPEISR